MSTFSERRADQSKEFEKQKKAVKTQTAKEKNGINKTYSVKISNLEKSFEKLESLKEEKPEEVSE